MRHTGCLGYCASGRRGRSCAQLRAVAAAGRIARGGARRLCKAARVGCTCIVQQVSGSRGSLAVEDRTTCDDRWDVSSTYAAGCGLLVICSLSGTPAWVACTT